MKKFYTFFLLCFAALALNAQTTYHVAGSMNGWSHQAMTQDATDENIWTFEFTAQAQEYEFKITDGKWNSEEYNASNIDAQSPVALSGNGTGNIKMTPSASEVVITFNASTKKVSAAMKDGENPQPTEPTEVTYYLAGTLPGCEWNPASQAMTQDSENKNLWKYTFTAEAQEYLFKITEGKGWEPQYNSNNIDENSPVKLTAASNDQNISVTFAAGEATIIFNAETKKISATGQQGETPVEETKYYVAGEMNNWTQEAMTQDAEHTNLWHYSFTAEKENVGFKVCSKPNWNGTNWGKDNSTDGGAENFPTNCKAGDYVMITFDADAKQITVAIGPSTGIRNAAAEAPTAKVVRNGVVYILRGDVLYTTTGQIAK